MKKNQKVAIVMGSRSDWRCMKMAAKVLRELGVSAERKIVSAHRTPHEMVDFAVTAHQRGIRVIIAGAGGAAHLPGMLASLCDLPVIGVPVESTQLRGLDSLLSIAQMPKGVPVACMAIENAANAGLLAARILAFGGSEPNFKLAQKLLKFRQALRVHVRKMKLP